MSTVHEDDDERCSTSVESGGRGWKGKTVTVIPRTRLSQRCHNLSQRVCGELDQIFVPLLFLPPSPSLEGLTFLLDHQSSFTFLHLLTR